MCLSSEAVHRLSAGHTSPGPPAVIGDEGNHGRVPGAYWFASGFSPERIDPGSRMWTLTTTPKIVSGIDAASLERAAAFCSGLVHRVVPVAGARRRSSRSCWRTPSRP